MIREVRLFIVAALLFSAVGVDAKSASEVFEIAAKSTVVVLAYNENDEVVSLGSGVVLPDGAVATNCHVIENAVRFNLRYKKQEYSAVARHTDWDRDICTVTARSLQAPPVALGSTKHLKVGARVYAIGAPRGLELSLSEGIISGLRPIEASHYIQTTAPISPGSSGGGLFDEDGRLLGLTSFFITEGQNLNFALPVEWINELPNRQADRKRAATSWLDWHNKALGLQENEDWAEALRHAEQWTKAMPKDLFAWYNLGHTYNKVGQPAKAVEAYQQALRIDSEHSYTWTNLGVSYDDNGMMEEAIGAYQKALRINPEDVKAWYNLGNGYADLGQMAKAIEAYQQALRVDPEHVSAWNNLGLVYVDVGQIVKAIEAYQQVLRTDPADASVWFNLGTAYGRSGKMSKAIESFQQALRIDPDYAKAWYNLGLAFKISGQDSKVMQVYHRLKALNPSKADEFFNEIILP